MPVSDAFCALSHDRSFWSDFLTAAAPTGYAATQQRELRLSFPVAGGYALILDLDLAAGDHALGLRQPATTEPVQLAWTAPDQPRPDALRWAEVDLVGRVVALDDPTLPHPGLPVALLSRFTPLTPDDDPTTVRALLEAAYRSLRRDVRAVAPNLPEQSPLPLFTDARWWPQPAQPSPQVLTEGQIADYLTLGEGDGGRHRAGPRFPAAGLSELCRLGAQRLDRVRDAPWFHGPTVLPLARRIVRTGDLALAALLVEVLEAHGCDHPTVLDALTDPVVPVQAGWVVETLAGAAPGALVGRPPRAPGG